MRFHPGNRESQFAATGERVTASPRPAIARPRSGASRFLKPIYNRSKTLFMPPQAVGARMWLAGRG